MDLKSARQISCGVTAEIQPMRIPCPAGVHQGMSILPGNLGSQLKHVGMITDPVGLAESSVRRALGTLYWAEGITCNAFGTGSREMMHLDGKSCNFQFPTIENKQKARDLIQINSTQRDKQRELPQK